MLAVYLGKEIMKVKTVTGAIRSVGKCLLDGLLISFCLILHRRLAAERVKALWMTNVVRNWFMCCHKSNQLWTAEAEKNNKLCQPPLGAVFWLVTFPRIAIMSSIVL